MSTFDNKQNRYLALVELREYSEEESGSLSESKEDSKEDFKENAEQPLLNLEVGFWIYRRLCKITLFYLV